MGALHHPAGDHARRLKTANTVRLEQKTAARLSWRMLAAEAILMADRAIASDGDELRIGIDFRHELAKQNQPKQAFPVEGVSAGRLAQGFVDCAKAMLEAAEPRRRVILAGPLRATARAIEELLELQATNDAATWKRRLGECE